LYRSAGSSLGSQDLWLKLLIEGSGRSKNRSPISPEQLFPRSTRDPDRPIAGGASAVQSYDNKYCLLYMTLIDTRLNRIPDDRQCVFSLKYC
jgi:hypothetical protein